MLRSHNFGGSKDEYSDIKSLQMSHLRPVAYDQEQGKGVMEWEGRNYGT